MRIGDATLDVGFQRLTRGDESHLLDPKAMGVLLHLAEAAPGFVSIDALLARTWAGVVVGDNALYQVISRLRRCFDDDPREPTVIETLSKRGYRLMANVGRETDEHRSSVSMSLAVLPFEDFSAAPADPYLAEGLTLEIGSQLQKVSALRIISRSAVSACLAEGTERTAVASRLGAAFALWGTARTEHGCVRVTVRIDDVDAKRQLWSATFDRATDDLLALHSEVAIAIAQALQTCLTALERARIDRPGTVSLAAYQLVQRAARFDPTVIQDNRLAIEILGEAIALDPAYAYALAELAWRHCWNALMGVKDELAAGRRYAERAVVADPQCSHAHFAMFKVLHAERRVAEAIQTLRRTIALDPSHLFAIQDLSWGLNFTGRLDEALALSLRAIELAPNIANTRHHLAVPLVTLTQYRRARMLLQRACAELPTDNTRHRCTALHMTVDLIDGDAPAARKHALRILEHSVARDVHEQALAAAETLLTLGEWECARRNLEAWLDRADSTSGLSLARRSVRTSYAFALWMMDSQQRAAALFDESYSNHRRRTEAGQDWVPAVLELAAISAVRGDRDDALQWLDRAYLLGYRQYHFLEIDPMFAMLRNDERFARVLSRMARDVGRMANYAEHQGLFARIDAMI